jgi:hypothetical protein
MSEPRATVVALLFELDQDVTTGSANKRDGGPYTINGRLLDERERLLIASASIGERRRAHRVRHQDASTVITTNATMLPFVSRGQP